MVFTKPESDGTKHREGIKTPGEMVTFETMPISLTNVEAGMNEICEQFEKLARRQATLFSRLTGEVFQLPFDREDVVREPIVDGTLPRLGDRIVHLRLCAECLTDLADKMDANI